MRPDLRSPWKQLTLALVAATAAGTASAGEPAPPHRAAGVLYLANGGHVAGRLVESARAEHVLWQPEAFAAPFDFATRYVSAIHMPVPTGLSRVQADTCVELPGGDALFGKLVRWDDQAVTVDTAAAGPVTVARGRVRTLTRLADANDVVFVGPSGLAGWLVPQPQGGWREEAGQLVSNTPGVALRGAFALPPRALIDFDLSWKGKPDFVLALGVGDTPASLAQAYRFEIVDDDLVIKCETEDKADVAAVGTVGADGGRRTLRVYLDQERGHAAVVSAGGETLAEVGLKEKSLQVLPGLVLINNRGDSALRLERLRVTRWRGSTPGGNDSDRAHVDRTDGGRVVGELVRFDAGSQEFVVRDGATETRIPAAQLASASLPGASQAASSECCVVAHDGTRLSGDLRGTEQSGVSVSVAGVAEPVRVPLDRLQSLLVLRHAPSVEPIKGGKKGVLEIDGARLPGQLTDGAARDGASCLHWRPDGSDTASPLRSEVSGRIVYREKPAPAPTRPAPAPTVINGGVMMRVFPGRAPATTPQPPAPRTPLSLHLVTGDAIPGEVTKIDDKGVWFKSDYSPERLIPHDKIKAVELARLERTPVRLPRVKRERLLTLPRAQKESPPTHLIQSLNGDYLRGRVLTLDDATLQVEVHLEAKSVPRNRVARVIWLHPGAAPTGEAAPTSNGRPEGGPDGRVQAVRQDGIRLTFNAERCAESQISGTSDVLGACHVAVEELDRLLIGRAIGEEAMQHPYERWKLQDAREPKYVQADGTGSAGTESELVGKPAPDFTLDLLDGTPFHLAASKGKVVVLDFWATWCGPCLQAMPQVEAAVKEFAPQDVVLVAVNLEETPKAVQAMLTRQKLELTVALDRDGVVAGKYKASAIPQTVVVDRDGNVARLFVGSGPHLGEQLRKAIRSAVEPGAKGADGGKKE